MYRSLSLAGLCLAVSACSPLTTQAPSTDLLVETNIALEHTECLGNASPNCTFFNGPVKLQPEGVKLASRKATFFPTVSQLDFVDARANRWIAPKDTLTDGASIPDIFISIIGNPTSAEFKNAATMHDAYCGIGNEDGARYHTDNWEKVHRMFYDGLRAGGTPAIKAKIMFSAVYLGGPRWPSVSPSVRDANALLSFRFGAAPGSRGPGPARSYGVVSSSAMVGQLTKAIAFIKASNPTLAELEIFLMKGEARAMAANGRGEHENTSGPSYSVAPY